MDQLLCLVKHQRESSVDTRPGRMYKKARGPRQEWQFAVVVLVTKPTSQAGRQEVVELVVVVCFN